MIDKSNILITIRVEKLFPSFQPVGATTSGKTGFAVFGTERPDCNWPATKGDAGDVEVGPSVSDLPAQDSTQRATVSGWTPTLRVNSF